jgi:hypothetical protein
VEFPEIIGEMDERDLGGVLAVQPSFKQEQVRNF